ncbi:YceD family protein [Ancylobacter defluvii]|uniref:Phosphodiesterase n=1 Tax=Ancylobacter defluvii TaxID=1282440 RepID=A0A9W6JW63_9HYPH|nr:DUF177 domain-containing protein [Ancylobacter defluvii]MBS7587683.1 DUF177 domain-containing protein [Ancylobacter defluvii]GLK82493.1 phosphodiesterase [Ancylobacter defluvii]
MSDAAPLTHPILVASIPDDGLTVKIAPDEAARAALAKDFGIVGIPRLDATVTLTPERGGGVRVGGHIEAVVRQTCVATLEDFDAPAREEIDLSFAPADRLPEVRPGQEIEVSEQDLPDPIVDGVIDIGAVVAEFLALGLDPYPRKPGAVFKKPAGPGPEEISPFAALARLKNTESGGDS